MGKNIIHREAKDSFDSLIIAQAMEDCEIEVFSITHDSKTDTNFPFAIWGKYFIEPENSSEFLSEVDDKIEDYRRNPQKV